MITKIKGLAALKNFQLSMYQKDLHEEMRELIH